MIFSAILRSTPKFFSSRSQAGDDEVDYAWERETNKYVNTVTINLFNNFSCESAGTRMAKLWFTSVWIIWFRITFRTHYIRSDSRTPANRAIKKSGNISEKLNTHGQLSQILTTDHIFFLCSKPCELFSPNLSSVSSHQPSSYGSQAFLHVLYIFVTSANTHYSRILGVLIVYIVDPRIPT